MLEPEFLPCSPDDSRALVEFSSQVSMALQTTPGAVFHVSPSWTWVREALSPGSEAVEAGKGDEFLPRSGSCHLACVSLAKASHMALANLLGAGAWRSYQVPRKRSLRRLVTSVIEYLILTCPLSSISTSNKGQHHLSQVKP